MIDITKPLVTADGQPVTIITDQFRLSHKGKDYKLAGYIGKSHALNHWDAEGNNAISRNFDLRYAPSYLYINIYPDGHCGVFYDEQVALDSVRTPTTRLKVAYVPGEKQF